MAAAVRRRDPAARTRPGARPGQPAPQRTGFVDGALALLLVALTIAVYHWTAGPGLNRQSTQPHFVLLASAILHGRLWLDPLRAAHLGDITPYAGHYYVSFPPMPAFLLLPFVAVAGPRFNDTLFSVCLGAVDIGLCYLLVRRLSRPGFAGMGLPIGRIAAIIVALTLGLGTVLFYSAVTATVWYLAHVVAVTFLLLYLLECAGRGRPLVAGLALAAAFLARTPAIFGLLFWCMLALRDASTRARLAAVLPRFAAPLALALAFLLWQNQVRFGSPTDFGYYKMHIAGTLAPRLRAHGQFSSAFLPDNLRALLLQPPLVAPINLPVWLGIAGGPAGLARMFTSRLGSSLPFPITFDPWGTGLWAVSPLLFLALRLPRRPDLPLWLAAWLSVIGVAVPDLFYYNTGWGQYGYRFLLDFAPFLMVVLAMSLRRPLATPTRVLGGVLL
ncbi:MAG TPA: hypothetical protein VGP33_17180, partial [Chloroflexota bacterium]|nr:hypothetical protein [Chloroflexota bacterium]